MKAIVHVNQHHIKHNRKQSKSDNPKYKPVITVKYGGKTHYTNEIDIAGLVKIIYSRNKPLSCGAEVWIECDSKYLSAENLIGYKEIT